MRARPQVLGCNPIWPEHWGLTRRQLSDLLERLQQDPSWHPGNNVYTLVDDFVIPWTRGQGIGYALLANYEEPKEVNVMVSHAWGENAEDFLKAVIRATAEEDVVYICALANYQAEDGVGPTVTEQIGSDPMESPFRRILNHIRAHGGKAGWTWRWRFYLLKLPLLLLLLAMALLCTPIMVWMVQHDTWQYDPRFQPERVRLVCRWLPASLGAAAAAAALQGWLRSRGRIYPGRMLVVPNYQVDIYSRLWCVYEIFSASCLGLHIELAPTLAPAGGASTRDAVCRSDEDTLRIRAEIEKTCGCGGFDMVDQAVRRVVRMVKWHTFAIWMKYFFLFAAPASVGPKQHLVLVIIYVATASLMVAAFFCVTSWNLGIFRPDGPVLALSLLALAVNAFMVSMGPELPDHFTGIASFNPAGFGAVFLGASCKPFPPFFSPRSRLPMLGAMMLSHVVTDMGLHYVKGDPCTINEIINVFIYAASLVFPIYMFWTEGLHWGVRLTAPRYPSLLGAFAWAALSVWSVFFLRIDHWFMLLLVKE